MGRLDLSEYTSKEAVDASTESKGRKTPDPDDIKNVKRALTVICQSISAIS